MAAQQRVNDVESKLAVMTKQQVGGKFLIVPEHSPSQLDQQERENRTRLVYESRIADVSALVGAYAAAKAQDAAVCYVASGECF